MLALEPRAFPRPEPQRAVPQSPSARAGTTHALGGAMPALEVWSGSARDQVVTLSDGPYMLGSDEGSAHITLADPAVSRVHAIFERVGTAWLLRDLDSRNGTRVNGE